MSLKASLLHFSTSLRRALSQRTEACLQPVNRWQKVLGKNLENSLCTARPCTEECSRKACVSPMFVSLMAALILSLPEHLRACYCFKTSAGSTFKFTSLCSILTGSLGQADMLAMNHRGGKESYGAAQIWLKNKEIVPR